MERLIGFMIRLGDRLERIPHIVAFPVAAVVIGVLWLALNTKQWDYLQKRI